MNLGLSYTSFVSEITARGIYKAKAICLACGANHCVISIILGKKELWHIDPLYCIVPHLARVKISLFLTMQLEKSSVLQTGRSGPVRSKPSQSTGLLSPRFPSGHGLVRSGSGSPGSDRSVPVRIWTHSNTIINSLEGSRWQSFREVALSFPRSLSGGVEEKRGRDEEEEEELQWAAIEGLPTYDRLRKTT